MKGKPFFSICIIVCVTLLILWFIKYKIELHYEEDCNNLIESYYQEQSTATETNANVSLYNSTVITTEETVQTSYGSNVDCILRVTDLGIELPVCKGNFKYDMESYRLSAYSNSMQLGFTTYTIMGHHSVALNVAFGWLDKIEEGTIVTLEQSSVINEYVVTEISVDYASELSYLFTVDNKDIVYLATCDYSLGNSDRIVYRVVKCERRTE